LFSIVIKKGDVPWRRSITQVGKSFHRDFLSTSALQSAEPGSEAVVTRFTPKPSPEDPEFRVVLWPIVLPVVPVHHLSRLLSLNRAFTVYLV
jgi:hypothetical protein